ncbi:MAG: hypothetical protein LBN37_00365 [Bacteroidales bacterium]|nr:hypothetical protein [Bacteroidales bacterium]
MKILATIPLICLLSANLPAQTSEPADVKDYSWYKDKDKNHHGRFTFTVHPSQLVTHQNFRIDAEMRPGKSRSWLQFGLNFPLAAKVMWEEEGLFYPYDIDMYDASLKGGVGLNFNYKYFFHRYLYVAGGPSWQYCNIEYSRYGWIPFVEDGIVYNEYGKGNYRQKINNLGLNAMGGFQKISRHNFLVDVYMGVAAQKAFYADPDADKFNSTMYSRGYTGCVFLIGVRIGFAGKPRY